MSTDYTLSANSFSRRGFVKLLAGAGVATGFSSLTGCSKLATSQAKGRVLIIGGGAAGISMAARLLRKLEDPDITLIDPSDRQYYQPGFTFVASGVYQPDEVWRKQESCMPSGVKWIKDVVLTLDPDKQQVTTRKSGTFDYDFLVLTPGLQINWNRVEGITRETLGEGNAHCIYDFEGAQKTWKAIQEFVKKGGRGVYTDTYTKHKCGGAPKKICLLTEHLSRKEGTRDKLDLDFFTASSQLYDVPFFTPRLLEIFKERNVSITTKRRVKGVDTFAKKVYMEDRVMEKRMVWDEQTGGEIEKEVEVGIPVVEEYDFLHFLPPMSAPIL